ncbi:MAG: GntR family transcriptional regulator [Gemmatimonadetes bacterium]|nr:GntR family transcriptional regulator [Gemmatimonadota bacterium]
MSKTTPLMLQLSSADPRPIVRQIGDGIRRAIASRELPVGAQLPSVRGLAQQLTVNPNTVAKAYSELAAEGWIDSRQGLGLFVAAPRQMLSDAERSRRLGIAIDTFAADVVGLGYPLSHVIDQVKAALKPVLNKRTA